MGIKDTKEGKLLYHLTRLENLESIIENGLVSRSILLENDAEFEDIANTEIINKRTQMGLDRYVPFHFHPYSSFDVAVKNTYDEEFIYICITRELAKHNGFKILPIHPLAAVHPKLYEYTEGLDAIDWDKMHTLGNDCEDVKHVKMAECLTDLVVPYDCFQSICVGNSKVEKKVLAIIKEKGKNTRPPYINIRPWCNKD